MPEEGGLVFLEKENFLSLKEEYFLRWWRTSDA